jgi:hypothetical protein
VEGDAAAGVRVRSTDAQTLDYHEIFIQARDFGTIAGIRYDGQTAIITAPCPGVACEPVGYVEVVGEATFVGTRGGLVFPIAHQGFPPGPEGTSAWTWAAWQGGLDFDPTTQDLADVPNVLTGNGYIIRAANATWDGYRPLALEDFRVTGGVHRTENYPPDDAVILVDQTCNPFGVGGFNGAAFCRPGPQGCFLLGATLADANGGLAAVDRLFYSSHANHYFNGAFGNTTDLVVLFPTRSEGGAVNNPISIEIYDTSERTVNFISPVPLGRLPRELNVVPIAQLGGIPAVIQEGWFRVEFPAGTAAVSLVLNHSAANNFIDYSSCQRGSIETAADLDAPPDGIDLDDRHSDRCREVPTLFR